MGAQLSKDPIETLENWQPTGTTNYNPPFPVKIASQSRFYCYLQQSGVWEGYFAIIDLRTKSEYNKSHIISAKQGWSENEGTEWALDLIVLLYDNSTNTANVEKLINALVDSSTPPSAVYIVDGGYSKFIKRYKFVASDNKILLPFGGLVELLPPTVNSIGFYAIHKVNFIRFKESILEFKINLILNISEKNLYLKSSNCIVENYKIVGDLNLDHPLFERIEKLIIKNGKSEQRNILIIDETGTDYAILIAGWYAKEKLNLKVNEIIESLVNRIGFVDPFYIDKLNQWYAER